MEFGHGEDLSDEGSDGFGGFRVDGAFAGEGADDGFAEDVEEVDRQGGDGLTRVGEGLEEVF